jgi:hypothetical protein
MPYTSEALKKENVNENLGKERLAQLKITEWERLSSRCHSDEHSSLAILSWRLL